MASSINSFNLKAENSGHVADVLATAANDSAADINYMGDALKYAGTPAHSLGISLEDTSAAIEVMCQCRFRLSSWYCITCLFH